jgi:hypothetical protein
LTLVFPNISRSFDTTRGCVRFSGYDHTKEVAFFLEEAALRMIDGGLLPDAHALVLAFDRHRDRICEIANRVYGKRREGSCTLKPADF